MPQTARFNDMAVGVCNCHQPPISTVGFIITTSPDVQANGLGIARDMDMVLAACGHIGIIVTYSPDVKSNGLGHARIGDTTTGCFVAIIVTGSPDVSDN